MLWCGPLISEERKTILSLSVECVMFLYLHLFSISKRWEEVLVGREEKWLLLLPLSLSVITPQFTLSTWERHLSPEPNFQFQQNHQNLTSLAPDSLITRPVSPYQSLPILSKAQFLPRYISRILHWKFVFATIGLTSLLECCLNHFCCFRRQLVCSILPLRCKY